jgi:hypothetical protein
MPDEEPAQESSSGLSDIKGLLRQLVAPVIEQLDARVSHQIDEQVDDHLDAALAGRLATVDRAIADLDRQLTELSARLDALEGRSSDAGEPVI